MLKKGRKTGLHSPPRFGSSAQREEIRLVDRCRCRDRPCHHHGAETKTCAWMKEYGGGLPTEKDPDITQKPAPTSSPRPTSKPASDPYNAGGYAYPDDFYDDHEDDFGDYEDAEDYWEKYN